MMIVINSLQATPFSKRFMNYRKRIAAIGSLVCIFILSIAAPAHADQQAGGGVTLYDKGIIACYFVFLIAIGLIFRRLSRDTSDYFRCGGAMPWWITGTSAWIAGFSAWTFVGAAAKVYETGTLVLWAYFPTVVALGLVYAYTCVRFRRMRVITWMEGVRARYGPGTEQFYTWVKLPLSLLMSGVSLNAIGVFMSVVFKLPMELVLVTLGTVVTIVALVGGSFAVLASDFVQMFLVMTITVVTAVLTLAQPSIGGLGGLLRQVPSAHFHWNELARPQIVLLWILSQVWFKFSDTNNIENSTMYLMSKSDKDARRMVLIPMIGSLIGPLIWFIPSMAATITHPHLSLEYPQLRQPHEAAFVAVARDVMPVGMIGLLLCAMLGATITSMDAGLNKGVGVFVRSFYLPVLNPKASEKRLLIVGKICTLVFGIIAVVVALEVNKLRNIGLFDLTNLLAATLIMPMALPLLFGLFFRRTPAWSAWSTALVGFVVAYVTNYHFKPEYFQHWMGWKAPLSDRETSEYFQLGSVTICTVAVASAWYFFTSLFYSASPYENRRRVSQFFTNLQTPIDAEADGIVDQDSVIYRLMGSLCLIYGVFILLLMLIPNSFGGRLCFLFCGGIITFSGAFLYRRSRRIVSTASVADNALLTVQPDAAK
jgi:solute:Na+ symporter, SSS family